MPRMQHKMAAAGPSAGWPSAHRCHCPLPLTAAGKHHLAQLVLVPPVPKLSFQPPLLVLRQVRQGLPLRQQAHSVQGCLHPVRGQQTRAGGGSSRRFQEQCSVTARNAHPPAACHWHGSSLSRPLGQQRCQHDQCLATSRMLAGAGALLGACCRFLAPKQKATQHVQHTQGAASPLLR